MSENLTNHAGQSELNVWYCKGCRKVHIKAEQVFLTFTRDEFRDFTNAVVECQTEQIFAQIASENDKFNWEMPMTFSEMLA